MYVPAAFAETDLDTLGAFVDAHPLASLALVVDGQAHMDHLPFMRTAPLTAGCRLIAHVAQGNPTWRHVGEGVGAVLAFTGASAYVSPSWYPSKKTTHQVVPTWNYASIHLRGRLRCLHDATSKRNVVDQLTRHMESTRSEPWSIDDAPTAYIEKMLNGIVGLQFDVDSIEAKFKASQNRSNEDRHGVVAGLSTDHASNEAATLAAATLAKIKSDR